MSKRTTKVRMAGRFGPRYGVRLRRRVVEVETRQRGRHECPKCTAMALSRSSTAIWSCRKCGYKYAGGAYYPHTPGHTVVERTIRESMEERAARKAEEEEER